MDNKVGGHSDWEKKFKRKCTRIIVSAETKKHYKWIICEADPSVYRHTVFSWGLRGCLGRTQPLFVQSASARREWRLKKIPDRAQPTDTLLRRYSRCGLDENHRPVGPSLPLTCARCLGAGKATKGSLCLSLLCSAMTMPMLLPGDNQMQVDSTFVNMKDFDMY